MGRRQRRREREAPESVPPLTGMPLTVLEARHDVTVTPGVAAASGAVAPGSEDED